MARRLTVLALALSIVLIAVPTASARTIKVHQGQSSQAAVDRANPHDTVQVGPGVYEEAGTACPLRPSQICAVAITDDNIKLMGAGDRRTTLRNPGGQGEGIEVGE